MYYSVQSIHFDNYRDNSKTAYLASSTHTRAGLEAKERRTLTLKVTMLVGKTRVPPTIGLCFGPVKRNGFSGPKPTIFMTRESAGIRPLRAGFLERRGREKPPRACPPYIRSPRSRKRPNPIMDSLRPREVLPVRQDRRTQPALVKQEEQSKKQRDTDHGWGFSLARRFLAF